MFDWSFIHERTFIKSIEALHIFSWAAWMAGMLYLPRLFVYHTKVKKGSEADSLYRIMEYKLQTYIMLPALLFTLLTGGSLTLLTMAWTQNWWHMKIPLVLVMVSLHFVFLRHRKSLTKEIPTSSLYFRILNEVPAVLLLVIIFIAVVKRF